MPTCLSSCKNIINQMQFTAKWWNMKDVQNILKTCDRPNIEFFNEMIKIAQFYFSMMAHYANMERFLTWCSHKPKRKRNISNWTSFQATEAGVQFKTSFMQAVSWYC